jgi:CheY-like chemotaxis protein
MWYYYNNMADTQKLILVVDDDKDLSEITATKLEQAGFRVEKATSGEEGIAKAKELKPDLVLLDVKMPGMTGIQVLVKMKAQPETADIKVLFLTNLGEADDQNAWVDDKFARETGALGHIKKTEDLDKIVARVKQELNIAREQ